VSIILIHSPYLLIEDILSKDDTALTTICNVLFRGQWSQIDRAEAEVQSVEPRNSNHHRAFELAFGRVPSLALRSRLSVLSGLQSGVERSRGQLLDEAQQEQVNWGGQYALQSFLYL